MTDQRTPQQDAATTLIRSNRRRRSIRKWVAIGTLPLTLAALLVVGKILSMYAFAHQSISAYVIADYAGSESAARGQEFLNWFEPYKAPFNAGTALAGAEELPEARAELERALELAHGLEVCGVRINLAIVVERMGDAASAEGDGVNAAALYAEALQIAAENPPECSSDEAQQQSSDPNRDMEQTQKDLEERLKQKQQQQPDDEEQPQEPQDQPEDDKLDDLKDKLEQGQQERDQQGQDGSGGSGTDKPW